MWYSKYVVISLLSLVVAPNVFSQKADSDNQSEPTSHPALIDVSDKAAIDAAMGKDVELEGIVKSAEWSSSGKVMLIKFEKSDESKVAAAVFEKKREAMDKAFNGDLAKSLVGAHVRIKGMLKDFKGHPEVIVDMPSQITIVEAAPSTKPS